MHRAGTAKPASAAPGRRSGRQGLTGGREDGTGGRVESIATRASRTRTRSRRATRKSASGSLNGASDLPITVDPGSIGPSKIVRPERSGIRADPSSTGLNRIARPDRKSARVDPGSIDLNRVARPDRKGARAAPGSIGLSRTARPDRNAFRVDRNRNREPIAVNDDLRVVRPDHNRNGARIAVNGDPRVVRPDRNRNGARIAVSGDLKVARQDRNRNGERIAVNGDLRVARSPIGAALVGSKRRRSRATRDQSRLHHPVVPMDLVRSLVRVKGLSRRLLRVRPNPESRRPGLRNAGAPIRQEPADGSCVITHVVLLRPRAGLSADERRDLADAFRTAVRTIPSIRRVRLGTRVKHGRQYEQAMRVDYEYAALLDFDDVGGLQAYLEHPAHEALAARFFQVIDEALMYDFELDEGESGLEKLL